MAKTEVKATEQPTENPVEVVEVMDKVEPEVAPPQELAKILVVRGGYKRMVDPHTGLAYEMEPTEVYKFTAWVKDQIDAGKLLVC